MGPQRKYEFIRSGCATGWDECPHGDRAITIIFDGQSLTSCIAREDPQPEGTPQ